MGDLYASAVGTTILQLKEIPECPEGQRGIVCLYGVRCSLDQQAIERDVASLCELCDIDGKGISCEVIEHKAASGSSKKTPPPLVHLQFPDHDHSRAEAFVKVCNDPNRRQVQQFLLKMLDDYDPERCDRVSTMHNAREYDERGWCCFEDSVSRELILQLRSYPKLSGAMAQMPPKVLRLSSHADPQPVAILEGEASEETRISHVASAKARIGRAKFTGKGDVQTVPGFYNEYVKRIARVLQRTLAFTASDAEERQVAKIEPPPTPTIQQVPSAWSKRCRFRPLLCLSVCPSPPLHICSV